MWKVVDEATVSCKLDEKLALFVRRETCGICLEVKEINVAKPKCFFLKRITNKQLGVISKGNK